MEETSMTDVRSKALALSAIVSLLLLPLLAAPAGTAEKGRVVKPLGKTLEGWLTEGPIEKSKWAIGIAKVDPDNPRRLVVTPLGDQPPELITAEGGGQDIFTAEKFGDCTVEIEVMVPQGSNSGIYLMGEYEIQVLDSYGRKRLRPGDMGGIYGATAPRVNACKRAGEWQKFVIQFQAPRFKDGKKVANARFIKIVLNDQVIHENVEMKQQTPGGVTGKEVPVGPLMLQGNHGPVAYRNIKITLPPKQ
jgi:hypothetical protein